MCSWPSPRTACGFRATSAGTAAITVYFLQLLVNFAWPPIFFNMQTYFAAFLWLLLLWALALVTLIDFWRVDREAGKLLLPYLLWLAFAGYLNLGAALLNR